ncbi:DUF2959 domain-containing protein [Pleionea sp. CnH1-48]|uniref:DUF2959 domain-containing protein n=1 Tax=Pleionea sp. CnH1-48 TaxID=2954494 RepID=UPI002096C670|nr:DUF2959 domain-containing protein [Pleionea sp. CnH1-48]MCO7226901.1 DUF2959 domain-containing protein [Pleionea sp. CnH1-48]
MLSPILKTGLFSALLILAGCQSAYYGAMEKVGIHKRDIMVDRVGDAKDSQNEAKEKFKSALEQFQFMFGRGDEALADKYERLNDAYEESESAAQEVTERIEKVESVSEALFEEWQHELGLYSSAALRRDSERKLSETKAKYKRMMSAMRNAERKMQPVLSALRDQVLYLKHNLNARAIDGLKGELGSVKQNVAALIRNMEKSIAESEAFIAQIKGS